GDPLELVLALEPSDRWDAGDYPARCGSIPEGGAGDGVRVAAGPGVEAVPGRLRFAVRGQQAGRVAELAGVGQIRPGEPPDSGDSPGAAMGDEHRHRLVELAGLPAQPALPARLEAVGPPAELCHVDRRRGVVVEPHHPAQVFDLGLYRAGV